jgi:chondroitin AC lyase
VIIERYRQLLFEAAPPDAKVTRDLAATLAADGRWPDVDYRDTTGSNWRPSTHLSRTRTLALALVHPKSPLAGDAAVKAAALRAFDHWVAKRYQCPNWWWNRIGVPMAMRDIVVLLEPELSAERLDKGWAVVAQSGGIDMTGANLVWVAGLAVLRAAREGDGKLLAQASARIAGEIKIGAGEGIQADFSFYQHGARLQAFHYGGSFAYDVCRLAWLLRGTPWAIPENKLAIMADYLIEGVDWMRRGEFTVPGTLDRAVSRPGALGGKRLAGNLRLLREAAPAEAKRIDAAIAREEGRGEALAGFRHFPRGDFTVCHRKGFSFFLKTVSSRTLPTESINGENPKGGLLHSGDGYFVRDGREYHNLMPVWDWDLLPGVTWSAGAPRPGRDRGGFVGGLGDGQSGLAAMACAFGEGGKYAPVLMARKAWFCHGDLVVHLIGDIRAPGLKQPVRTALDQCRAEGDVTVAAGGRREAVRDAASRRFEVVSWLHHRGVAYVLLSPGSVTLKAGEVSGSWRSINAGQPAGEVKEKVFLAVLEHGAKPEGASAAYLLAPAAAADDAAALAARPGVEVLANDGARQAVRFADGTIMAAFFAAGALGDKARPLLAADAPCLVMVRGGKVRACNPAFKALNITVEAVGVGRVRLALPGDGTAAKAPL